ncbi:phosphate-starvation-inducible PsiE family protein [Aquiflexum gelatinilyticum]|uniref:Phosphate-starvation-inducible PsiE family protein n=1 Tax=Aquiflexum gelatinilyticum TaxID=2961943 RepID=A0A9X2SZ04_9BACT|nr:phosphate-starvation-inducible PsiE family protein [Aquiflexum gelatinilyticum]MCR9013863.1 phosphate-starvation-inducible PsiE family protein [Aquiflexum gelatinilyticum]
MKIISQLTLWTIRILVFFLIIILIVSLLELGGIIVKAILASDEILIFRDSPLVKEGLFLAKVQGLISAVLLITILIELIGSLVEYIKEGNANYIKIIVEIALIALLRHLLGLDVEHVATGTLIGISALLLVLGGFYYLLKKIPAEAPAGDLTKE